MSFSSSHLSHKQFIDEANIDVTPDEKDCILINQRSRLNTHTENLHDDENTSLEVVEHANSSGSNTTSTNHHNYNNNNNNNNNSTITQAANASNQLNEILLDTTIQSTLRAIPNSNTNIYKANNGELNDFTCNKAPVNNSSQSNSLTCGFEALKSNAIIVFCYSLRIGGSKKKKRESFSNEKISRDKPKIDQIEWAFDQSQLFFFFFFSEICIIFYYFAQRISK